MRSSQDLQAQFEQSDFNLSDIPCHIIPETITERRRSARLWLTFPVRIEGVDATGHPFEYSGHAINLCRNGARIQSPVVLEIGQGIGLRCAIGQYSAEFLVIRRISFAGEKGGEYGVRCLDEDENFWGIEFPNLGEGETADAKVLLECRACRSIALLPVTLAELEMLRTIGVMEKSCARCTAVTRWRYAEVRVPMSRTTLPAASAGAASRHWVTGRHEPIGRCHRRVLMQVPVGIRALRGSKEVTRTENMSKRGFCFSSEKDYVPGETVMVVFPLDQDSQKKELAARIARAQTVQGTVRKIYGATFGSRTDSGFAAA